MNKSLNPDESVAFGAAVIAAIYSGCYESDKLAGLLIRDNSYKRSSNKAISTKQLIEDVDKLCIRGSKPVTYSSFADID